ncbi:glycosyltransferase family 9 protein [Pirellulaceae bacterium SH449]
MASDRLFLDQDPGRILIVRLSSIGDVVLSVPALCALRKRFPNAQIGWVVEGQGAQLLDGHEDLDELFVTTKAAFKSPKEFFKLAKILRQWGPDVTIDLQGLAKSAWLAYFTRAETRLGFAKGDYDGREFSCWVNNQIVTPKHSHLILRGLEILRPLGVASEEIEFRLPEHPEDTRFFEDTLKKEFGGRNYALINVGARWVSRLWPADRYAEVADYLSKRWGLLPVILWNGETELQIAKQVQEFCEAESVLGPSCSLKQLRSLIRGAAIFVGSDTGPMHLSVAVSTPTVGMIGPMPLGRTGPIGPKHRAVQKQKLPPERKSERRTDCGPILSIMAQDVIEACESILEQSKS